MCGIAGEVRVRGMADAVAVQRMMQALHARGPDAGGLFLHESVALGHRRLSILDLSPSSLQPMVDSELGLAVVFNGCIYNFRELREELTAKGYSFFSSGDTEVIIKAYHAWGARCVERFLGMFAFAIRERATGRVVLARDRLGIKPLYYAEAAGAFRFASSLPALLAAGDVDTSIDPVGLHQYMSLHAVVPAPRTILNGVRKLAPARIMTIEPDGTRHESAYWSLDVGPRSEDAKVDEEEWRERVLAALTLAVKRRSIADVPTGVLLSGGLDSSLVVALLAAQGQSGLKTFSVGFEAVNGIEGDEFKYSDVIARDFATDHTKISVDPARTLGALPDAIKAMSEPMMSHDSVGFYLLSQEVSKHVKVVQSGQGADEIFAGYHWYQKMVGSQDPVSDYAAIYFDRGHDEMRRTLQERWIGEDHSRSFIETYLRTAGKGDPVDKILQLDTEVMLVDDPVKRVDNMTMAFGIEARVPFLDHELVELAARIPTALKLKDGGKFILKEAGRRVLPAEVIDRPKGYFPVPALKYIRGPYLDFVREVLESKQARGRGLLRQEYVNALLSNPDAALTPKGHSKVWQAALLESWFQAHGL
ncbi:MAG: asparagine synthase family amidotransferase [Hyphomicrobiales bacterium]|nr:asparagine synthase family amidotransferase [Hyphomicrobiales bacterium]